VRCRHVLRQFPWLLGIERESLKASDAFRKAPTPRAFRRFSEGIRSFFIISDLNRSLPTSQGYCRVQLYPCYVEMGSTICLISPRMAGSTKTISPSAPSPAVPVPPPPTATATCSFPDVRTSSRVQSGEHVPRGPCRTWHTRRSTCSSTTGRRLAATRRRRVYTRHSSTRTTTWMDTVRDIVICIRLIL